MKVIGNKMKCLQTGETITILGSYELLHTCIIIEQVVKCGWQEIPKTQRTKGPRNQGMDEHIQLVFFGRDHKFHCVRVTARDEINLIILC